MVWIINLENKENNFKVEAMEEVSRTFFCQYGNPELLGTTFFLSIYKGENVNSKDLFDQVVNQCGYTRPNRFFKAVFNHLRQNPTKPVVLNGIRLPNLYLYEILQALFPEQKVHSIKTEKQLKQIKGDLPLHADGLQPVLDQFPVKLSDHVLRQSMISKAVFMQYMPCENELDHFGHKITFDGHFKNGLLEQMYQNRVVFLLDMNCPVYCRFCFRKHKSNRKERTPSPKDVKLAVNHVKNNASINEILITGGEPFLNRANLDVAVQGLLNIDHVQFVRIATRSIANFPEIFLQNQNAFIKDLIQKNNQAFSRGKAIELGIHLLHPDEISLSCLTIITDLIKNGIRVYLQTPFLKGINTDGKTLGKLFKILRQTGVQIYYIFTPCSPIYGTKNFWSPVTQAFEAEKYLHENLSDRSIPKLCTATSLGKIEWHTSGWAVEKDQNDPSFTWIRTPYTKSYFEQFIKNKNDISDRMPPFRVNKEGTLDTKYRLDMGKKELYLGVKPNRVLNRKKPGFANTELLFSKTVLLLKESQLFRKSVSQVPTPNMSRFNKACIELSSSAGNLELEYILSHPEISDVVLHCSLKKQQDIIELENKIISLKKISHITCVRLCFPTFIHEPEKLTLEGVEKIMSLSDFSIGNPFRIEIETWATAPGFSSSIGTTIQTFLSSGVNIYANVPLISGLNSKPKIMVQLAHELRECFIEFHHLYVSGLSIQNKLVDIFNLDPISKIEMVGIASAIRTDCSGREIPKYRIQNKSGDRPFRLWDY